MAARLRGGVIIEDASPLLQTSLLHQRVRISGLAAKPEFNGCFGKCVSWDAEKGRYGVALEGRKESLSLKFANLTLADAEDGAMINCDHCGAHAAPLRCTRCLSRCVALARKNSFCCSAAPHARVCKA